MKHTIASLTERVEQLNNAGLVMLTRVEQLESELSGATHFCTKLEHMLNMLMAAAAQTPHAAPHIEITKDAFVARLAALKAEAKRTGRAVKM